MTQVVESVGPNRTRSNSPMRPAKIRTWRDAIHATCAFDRAWGCGAERLAWSELRAQGLDEGRPETTATADDAHATLDPSSCVSDEIGRREARVELPARRREA